MSMVESLSAALPLVERRMSRCELRVGDNGDDAFFTLRGYAATFGKLSEDLGGFREIIEPGFFRAALRKSPDVRALINHDANLVLGRCAADTLELREDKAGLHTWARVAPTSYATDLRTNMQCGNVDQMSFAFTIRDGGDDWALADDGTVVRTLRADGCDELFDVSVVTNPAYPSTSASMRMELRGVAERAKDRMPPEAALLLGFAAQVGEADAAGWRVDDQAVAEARMRVVRLRQRALAARIDNHRS